MERGAQMNKGVVKGFGVTDPEDIQFCLEEMLKHINFIIDDTHCCLKHLSMQTVLKTLRTMMKQRCDYSFTPLSYKQCTNCNFMAEEDEEVCFSCYSFQFRLARSSVTSL
jgi:hypothetical protein